MILLNLDNLVKTGQLKNEPFNEQEFNGLMHSANARFQDALNTSLAIESRFDLAYNAAHGFALSALRYHGYRSNNRFIVFQALAHTLEVGPEIWRVLAKCHDRRNIAEYEGDIAIDKKLLEDLLNSTQLLLNKLNKKVRAEIS